MDLKKTLWLLGLFIGITLFVVSSFSYPEKRDIIEKGVLVEGKVRDINTNVRSEDWFSKVQIQYNCNGNEFVNRSKDKTFVSTIFINDVIGVYCDPNSDKFVIDRRDTKYITFEYFFYGLLCSILGAWGLFWYLQRHKLQRNWIVLKTKISDIIKEEDGDIVYSIVSNYIKDGVTYAFKSEEFISTQTISHVKVWDTVDVWVKPENYDIYIMNTDALNTQVESKTPEWINIVALIFWVFIWLVSIVLFRLAWMLSDQEIIILYTIIWFWSIALFVSLYLLNKVKKLSK